MNRLQTHDYVYAFTDFMIFKWTAIELFIVSSEKGCKCSEKSTREYMPLPRIHRTKIVTSFPADKHI